MTIIVQPDDHRLCRVETNSGSVNSSIWDRHARGRVSDVPAPATIGRVPDDIESAADEREGGKVAERWELRGKTVCPIGACDVVGRAREVVICVVGSDAQAHGRRR